MQLPTVRGILEARAFPLVRTGHTRQFAFAGDIRVPERVSLGKRRSLKKNVRPLPPGRYAFLEMGSFGGDLAGLGMDHRPPLNGAISEAGFCPARVGLRLAL
jgi:hypothetical protein